MAEQVGHNVVNGSQSASASALADAAASQTSTTSAERGNPPATRLTKDTPENFINHALRMSNGSSFPQDAHSGSMRPAEPSAGNAEHRNAEFADGSAPNGQHVSATLTNSAHDTALLTTDGVAEDGRSTSDISIDQSVHSDTDTSRADHAEQGNDGHEPRTNSVRKPTTFSKISVTKNFLAKSATPMQTVARISEKPTPVSTPTPPLAKPRLVAKTGSALQTAHKAGLAATHSTGPDASKVWNRNRPAAPPPPPKTLTDEQLKQQYGIHLATRLQTDDNDKEAKWADIDDEEDDWAPDAVVWMDGTKSTLAPAVDAAPAAPEMQKPGPQQVSGPATQQLIEQQLKPSLVPKTTRPTGPPKTILKPGSAAQLAKLQGSPSTTPANDRSSLKAKSPAPAPAKSPWAPLPPVDSVSPINPPVQQASVQPSLPPQDARAYEVSQPQPTREIAADSFDRSWRESEGGQRELFNSTNGRYEPAGDARRGSMRNERKPSLLQRPMPMDNSALETAGAVQARTGAVNDGSFGHRRGSNISQASHPSVRRTSTSKGTDFAPSSERHSSTASGHDAALPVHVGRIDQARPNFAQQSPWDAQMPPRSDPDVAAEDPVKVQERVMREKRELAIKRRKEEEEQQEAEKQERLKARLAALEGAGKSRKEREAEAAAATTPLAEKEVQQTVATLPATVEAPAQPRDNGSTVSKEFAPTQRQTLLPEQAPAILSDKPSAESLPERTTVATEPAQRIPSRSHISPGNGATLNQQPPPQKQTSSSYSSPGDRKAQPFERAPLTNSGQFSPWGPPPSNGNVWGSSGIGNGTFGKASSFAPRPLQGSHLPPPPGMVRPGAARVSPQRQSQDSRSPSLQTSQVAEPLRVLAPPGIDSLPEDHWGQGRGSGVVPASSLGRQPHAPGPIAPPSRAQQPAQSQVAPRQEALSSWNRAAQSLPFEQASSEPRKETVLGTAGGTIKATFKQTARNQALTGPRRLEKTEYMVSDSHGTRMVTSHNPTPPGTQTRPSGPISTTSAIEEKRNDGENMVRIPDGSRNPAHGGLLMQQPPIAPPSVARALSASPGNVHFATGPLAPAPPPIDLSPPPPEVVSGSVTSLPKVRLPPPPPVVKLPPALAQAQQVSSSGLPRPFQTWGTPGANRPIAQNPDWQARFNGLFNRTPIQTEVPPSPPRTPPKTQGAALAVASSSKSFLENASLAATVSLPSNKSVIGANGFTVDASEDVISKETIEPIFYEELSFGSLPKIRIPHNTAFSADIFETPKVNLLKMGVNSMMKKQIEAQSREPAEESKPLLYYRSPDSYYLRVPGTRLNNKPVHYESTDRRVSNQNHGNRKASTKFAKGKGREGGTEETVRAPRKASGIGEAQGNQAGKGGDGSHRQRSGFMKRSRGQQAIAAAP